MIGRFIRSLFMDLGGNLKNLSIQFNVLPMKIITVAVGVPVENKVFPNYSFL